MAEETTTIIYDANLQPLVDELAKATGLSEKQAKTLVSKVSKQLDKLQKNAAEGAKKSATAWQKASKKIGAALGAAGPVGVATAALALMGATAVKAAQGVFELAAGTSAYLDQIALVQNITGLGAETVAALDFAAQSAGGSLKDLESGLKFLLKTANEASAGNETAAKKLAQLGIDAEKAGGGLKSMDVLLREALDSIGQVEDETERAAAATLAFGEDGAKVAALLGRSSTDLDEWTAAVADSGIVSSEVVGSFEDWDRVMAELNLAITATKNTLSSEFAPAIIEIARLTVDAVAAMREYEELTRLFGVVLDQVFTGGLVGATTQLLENTAAMRELSGEGIGPLLDDFTEARPVMLDWAANMATSAERTKAAAAAQKELAKAHAEATRGAKEATAATSKLVAITTKLNADQLDAAEAVLASRKENLAAIRLEEEAGADALVVQQARLAAFAKADRELAAITLEIEEAKQDGLNEIRDEALNRQMERAAEEAEIQQAQSDLAISTVRDQMAEIAGLLDSAAAQRIANVEALTETLADSDSELTKRERAELEERLEMEKKAARAAFETAKALRIGETIIATATAMMAAMTAGPIAGPILAVAAGIMGGVQLGIIAGESLPFHTGGRLAVPSTAPDEINAKLLRNERVLTAPGVNAAGGQNAVDSLNAGSGGMQGGNRPITFQYENRSYNDFSRDNQRIPGSPRWMADRDPLFGRTKA